VKVPVILQARMGSSRLPGKSLREIEGKPLLQWVIERLRLSLSGEVILATTRKGEDDPLASLAERLGVPVFRGSESDVLSRYYRVSLLYPAPYYVRATGDNPLVDPGSIDRLLKVIEGGGIDYALEKGLPYGGATEIFTRQALHLCYRLGTAQDEKEHVTLFMKRTPELFKALYPDAPEELLAPLLRLTVDTEEDLLRVQRIYKRYHGERGVELPRVVADYREGGEI